MSEAPLDLPLEVLESVRFPAFEDLGKAIIGHAFPELPCFATIPFKIEEPEEITFVLVRRYPGWGLWTTGGGDPRFVDTGMLAVHVYTQDPDGDEKGAVVSEAIRVKMQQASREHWGGKLSPVFWPELRASVLKVTMMEEPIRKTDWATSTGPVQEADLPNGWWRYETHYQVKVRFDPSIKP